MEYTPRSFLIKLYQRKNEGKPIDINELKKDDFRIDLNKVKSVGNNSYIPVEMVRVKPVEICEGILFILDYFEKEKNVEILSWFIEKEYNLSGLRSTYITTDINGVWITHKPK